MNPLKLIDGKFYRDGIEVPVKIGDSEQIALVHARERAIDNIAKTGAECTFSAEDIRFDAVCDFKCVCGARVLKSEEKEISCACTCDFEEEVAEMFEDFEIQCRSCKQEYVIDNGKAKMINKRKTI